jgi:hypothetical protein
MTPLHRGGGDRRPPLAWSPRAARRRDDSKEYLILNQLGRVTAPRMPDALRSALVRTREPRSVRHSGAIWARLGHRLRKSYLHFPLSRAKGLNNTACRRRDSNPRHADYDSARLWLCGAKRARNGARMAHESHGGQHAQRVSASRRMGLQADGNQPHLPTRAHVFALFATRAGFGTAVRQSGH